jgi:hypothetical protein
MATTITDVLMTSDQTRHYAVAAGVITTGLEYWHVSWLPDGVSRDEAITALMLAEVVAMHGQSPEGRLGQLVEQWADELGLTARQAVELLADDRPNR